MSDKSNKQSCATCAWLEVPPDKDGKQRIRKSVGYRCGCPVPALPALPDSITKHYGYRWPPTFRSWVLAEGGKSCPAFSTVFRGNARYSPTRYSLNAATNITGVKSDP